MDERLTIRQAAKRMGRSRAWVEKLIGKGRLEVVERVSQIGQPKPIRLVRRTDVDRLAPRNGR